MRGFMKKTTVFFIAFFATCAIVTVDYSCAKAASRESYISVSAVRQENNIIVSGFGREFTVDLEYLQEHAIQAKDRVTNSSVWKFFSLE